MPASNYVALFYQSSVYSFKGARKRDKISDFLVWKYRILSSDNHVYLAYSGLNHPLISPTPVLQPQTAPTARGVPQWVDK